MSVWKLDEKLLILESLISPTKILLLEKYYLQCIRHNVSSQDETPRSSSKKRSAVHRILNSLLGVSSGNETLRLMLNILYQVSNYSNKYFEGSRYSGFFRFWLNFDIILYTANGSTNRYSASCLHQCQFNSSCVGSFVQNDYGGDYWSRWSLLSSPRGHGLRIWKGWGCSSEILN